jgi:hypothetical protein
LLNTLEKTSKVIFFIAFLCNIIFSGGASKYLFFYTQALQMIFHLPMIKVNFPANVLQLMTNIRSIVMFDFLDNPWEINTSLVLNFDEQGE